jgi:hypothetical protein
VQEDSRGTLSIARSKIADIVNQSRNFSIRSD